MTNGRTPAVRPATPAVHLPYRPAVHR